MIAIICWKSFCAKLWAHISKLINSGFKGLRIFFNLCDLPYKPGLSDDDKISSSAEWQSYINHCFATMPDGKHAWTFETFPKPFWSSDPNEMMKDAFDFCQKYNWLPIVCMGYQEEKPYNWLATNESNRAIPEDKWKWLGRFSREFAIYLKNTYKFERVDLEVYNEPTKLQGLGFGYDKYSKLAYIMGKEWKSVDSHNKLHIYADNLAYKSYLDGLMQNVDLMKITDYVSTHCLTHEEWDDNLIDEVNEKLKKYPHIRQVLTEMSPNGKWNRMQKLLIFDADKNVIGHKVDMYGMILPIRCDTIGTGFDYDDIWIYEFDKPENIRCTSEWKEKYLHDFNSIYAKGEDLEMEYLRPEELQEIYTAFGIKTPYHVNTPNLFVVGEKSPAKTLTWADIDAMEETRMKALIIGLKKIGVLPTAFPVYPNIKYNGDGSYNSNWLDIAKSNPKP